MAETLKKDRGLFDGVLLASDYDGTLVPDTKIVTPGVKKALQFFEENGGRFTVCTGRCYLGFHSYSRDIINAPVLLANGGMAYDYEKAAVTVDNGIGDEGIVPLRAAAERFPDVTIEFYPLEKSYAIHLLPKSEHHFTSQFIPFEVIDDPTQAPRRWAKVMIGGTPERIGEVQDIKQRSSQLVDILNYHTVLLNSGEQFGNNKFYKTKHGGEIMLVGDGSKGSSIVSGAQIDNGVPASLVEDVYNEKNGKAFRLDHIIQAPQNSVSKTLRNSDQFSEFYEVCSGFSATDILKWAGISDELNSFNTTEQDQYIIFTSTYGTGNNAVKKACLDENVKMFNTYNYTLYAPDNAAMEEAYANGLPRWVDIQNLFEQYTKEGEEAPESVRADVLNRIKTLREFVRYHFQSISLYADNTVEDGTYQSLATNELGLARELEVTGGNGKINVTDAIGMTHTVDANATGRVANAMARDYWFNSSRTSATSITTSSFCAVHEIATPFYLYKDAQGKPSWNPNVVMAGAKAQSKRK